MDNSDYIRLHITPLNPKLLQTYIPASIRENVRNISYHEIQTFPENNYGFIELPRTDAERIRKKLHGSIIKNVKVRIEVARPIQYKATILSPQESENLSTKNSPPSQTASTKTLEDRSKKRINQLPGVDIGIRHVKRGWTVPAHELKKINHRDKPLVRKAVVKSKFTPGRECLFKLVLPSNLVISAQQASQASKRKRKPNEFLVHEFSKTKKYATFLRDNNNPASTDAMNRVVAKYVESEGWFDQQNNLIEKVTPLKLQNLKL
ncbi:hypothetical protein HI914_02028 [Erysiphe necator]|nr:hypothetical protein HI914_02028 [Erysiphe necator]